MDNAEKITVEFECPNCHQQKKLKKQPALQSGKMKCPNCGTLIKLVFDINANPQTATATIVQPGDNNQQQQELEGKKKTVYNQNPQQQAAVPPVPPVNQQPQQPQQPKGKGETSYIKTGPAVPPPIPGSNIGAGKSKTVVVGVEDKPKLNQNVYLNRLGKRNKIIEKYRIYEGAWIIGRTDPVVTSDIMFDNDPEMSRQSIQLQVIPSYQGVVLRVKLLKATNPVVVGSRSLLSGEEVAVNFNEVITLGRSQLMLTTD